MSVESVKKTKVWVASDTYQALTLREIERMCEEAREAGFEGDAKVYNSSGPCIGLHLEKEEKV